MVAAPVFIMDLTVDYAVLGGFTNHIIVEAPTFILFTTLVSNVPKAVLYLSRILLSKRVCEAHPDKVRKTLPF